MYNKDLTLRCTYIPMYSSAFSDPDKFGVILPMERFEWGNELASLLFFKL